MCGSISFFSFAAFVVMFLETAALASALTQVNKAVVRARAANWCALMWTIGADAEAEIQIQRILQADFELAPPEIKQRPI